MKSWELWGSSHMGECLLKSPSHISLVGGESMACCWDSVVRRKWLSAVRLQEWFWSL